MRRAFTLIELLVIIGIMGAMVTVSVMSVRSGQGVARVRGAARDVFAIIRHARSVALVSQHPAIITYSCVMDDGEPVAKVEITTTQILDTSSQKEKPQTLKGEELEGRGHELVHIEKSEAKAFNTQKDTTETATEGGDKNKEQGQGVEDILFAPVSEDVVRGMRLKVTMGDEMLTTEDEEKQKSKLSVFSNVDFLLGRYNKAKTAAAKAKEDEKKSTDDVKADEDLQEAVSVVWETNGRVEPHRVWIYPDGAKPEDGLSIKIDRFGAAKVISKEDDE